MNCPDCRAPVTETDYRGIEIDECTKCKGRWFDRDELRKAKDKTDDDLRWLDFDPFGDKADTLSVASEGKPCPKCLTAMLSLKYKDSGTVIDKCSKCKGIWLNHREFERIVKYLENIVLAKSASDYAKDAFKQFVEVAAGPEGVISEVKDFLAVLKLLELRIAVEHPGLVKASQKIYQQSPFK